MATVEELEVLLGEARAELLVAQRERDEAQNQLAAYDKTIKTMSARYDESLEEVKRVATESYKLVEGMEKHMAAGDALRNRLAKVTDALAKADAFILVLDKNARFNEALPDAFTAEIRDARAAYADAKLYLQTMDG